MNTITINILESDYIKIPKEHRENMQIKLIEPKDYDYSHDETWVELKKRANRLKDRSVSITFNTSLEESPEGFMEIDKEINQAGIIYFKSSGDLTAQEIKEIDNVEIEIEGKTKSQRMRNVLYVMWEQSGEGEFKDFYSLKMEEIISHFKKKLV